MSKYFSLLLGGDWGSGKTTCASTAPKPVLFLDVDNKLHKMENLSKQLEKGDLIQWAVTERLGTTSLSRMAGTKFDEGRDKYPVPRPKGYEQLSNFIDILVANQCVIEEKGKKIKVETVVLDSYTSTNEHVKALILAANGSMAMSMPLWGVLLRNFETLNSTMLSLPCNVIFIVHERWDKDELSGRINVRPLIDGQMSNKIGKDFEEVYYLSRYIKGEKIEFTMHPWGDNLRQGRTSRTLPVSMPPDLGFLGKEEKSK